MTDRITRDRTSPYTRFVLEADLQSQSIPGNYSVVACYIRAINTGDSSSAFWGNGINSGYIEGLGDFARREENPFMPSGVSGGTVRWRIGGNVTVPHNGDGTKTIRLHLYTDYDGSATDDFWDMVLPTIARTSQPSFSPSSTFDAGTATTILTNQADPVFTHDAYWYFGSQSGSFMNFKNSKAWTPPLSLLTEIPDAVQAPGHLQLVTWTGAGKVGEAGTPFTLKVPASVKPTISSLTLTDNNPTVVSQIGALVQGQSVLKCVVNAAGAYGSTIQSRKFSVDGVTVDSGGTIPLGAAGTRAVGASAVDSRGRTAAAFSQNITVLAYQVPQIPDMTVERCDAAGTPDPTGQNLKLTVNATVTGLTVSGTQKQNLTYKVWTRPRGTGAWTARNTATQAGLTLTTSMVITGGAIFAGGTAYEVKLDITDKLNTSERQVTVTTVDTIAHAAGGKFAYGKMIEAAGPKYQYAGPARIYGATQIDGNLDSQGFDFRVGAGDQTSRGNSGASRALVKDGSASGPVLHLNYAGDFTGGTQIGGALLNYGVQNISGTSLDSLNRTGWFSGNNLTGAPDTGYWYVNCIYIDGGSRMQTIYRLGGDAPVVLTRKMTASTFRPWLRPDGIVMGGSIVNGSQAVDTGRVTWNSGTSGIRVTDLFDSYSEQYRITGVVILNGPARLYMQYCNASATPYSTGYYTEGHGTTNNSALQTINGNQAGHLLEGLAGGNRHSFDVTVFRPRGGGLISTISHSTTGGGSGTSTWDIGSTLDPGGDAPQVSFLTSPATNVAGTSTFTITRTG